MEKQTENSTNLQGGDLSNLKKMFSDFQKNQNQGGKRKSREDLLAKYFVPRKPKETFRILPPKAGKKHIEEAFFHVVTTTAAGGKKKHGTVVYCPAHNDPKVKKLDASGNPILDANGCPIMIPSPCPLCAKYTKMVAKQDQTLKGIKKENMNSTQLEIKAKNDEIYKEAIKWVAKKFYIVRGIDKGAEKDGVKFWRFKHNFKNDGTLDKLLPVLEQYMTIQQADFSSEKEGTDLSIVMVDSEFNGHVYKKISAIMFNGKSLLHQDPIVIRQWLDDDITWRDVFKPKNAPGITSYEFLEMIVNGTNPYWDDTDANNKHWVFPGRPDLEAAANTRNRDLDNDETNFEFASDVDEEEYPRVTINNITPEKVGTYTDTSVDLGATVLAKAEKETPKVVVAEEEPSSEETYDDLPF
jgi:hypothetical protein